MSRNAQRVLWSVIGLLVACAVRAAGPFGAPVGARAVGYRSEWIADVTRHFDVPDERGVLHPGPRWVHVHLWYPARPATGTPMTLDDYFSAGRVAGVPQFVIDLIHANDFGTPAYSFRAIFKSDSEKLTEALHTRMSARASADPAAGKWPVVVHVVGQNDFTQDAVLYAEYLASRGYIVVTVPYLGTSARRSPLLVHDPSFYENLLRDLELALTRKALTLPSADADRVYATGHSYGGIYALLLAMRGSAVKAVIGLDPTYAAKRAPYEYDLSKFAFWNPRLATPIVTLRRQQQNYDDSVLNSLPRAERLEIVYEQILHGDYASVPFWKRDLPASMQLQEEIAVRSPREAVIGATHVFQQVAALLDALSAQRNPATALIANTAIRQTSVVTRPQESITPDDVYWVYRKRGVAEASKIAAQLPAAAEATFVAMAKEEAYYGRDAMSVDLFRLLRPAFPDSASAQLAAAKALQDAGKQDEAKAAAAAALRIDPQLAEAKKIFDAQQH